MEDAMQVDLNKLAREDPLLLDKCRQDSGGASIAIPITHRDTFALPQNSSPKHPHIHIP